MPSNQLIWKSPITYISSTQGKGIVLPKSVGKISAPLGSERFDILMQAGYIVYRDNKFTFSALLEANPQKSAARILGKIAEAVVVKNCTQNIKTNQQWIKVARRNKNLPSEEVARKYIPLGTGLKKTRQYYHTKFNSTDPQRDIIWVEKDTKQDLLMTGGSRIGRDRAGIQLKVSSNLEYLLRKKYEVPIVFFDLFDKIHNAPLPLIDVRLFDDDSYYELIDYRTLVEKLLDGKLDISDLMSAAEDYPTIQSAIMSTALEVIHKNNYICGTEKCLE